MFWQTPCTAQQDLGDLNGNNVLYYIKSLKNDSPDLQTQIKSKVGFPVRLASAEILTASFLASVVFPEIILLFEHQKHAFI